MKNSFPILKPEDFASLDRIYLRQDKARMRRSANLLLIPEVGDRRGGKLSYGEWAHVIGMFQTLICGRITTDSPQILDVGCGTGLLAIACQPFVSHGGLYTGLDVNARDLEFCRGHYTDPCFRFVHHQVANAAYAPEQNDRPAPWDLPDESMDLVTALSVWTHLSERDALYYFREVGRVLRPGGSAIITFFLLDDNYRAGLARRGDARGRYHLTGQMEWIFDQSCPPSGRWKCPAWATVPEMAIGLPPEALDQLCAEAGLTLTSLLPGNWKEAPGLFFQDIVILHKP